MGKVAGEKDDDVLDLSQKKSDETAYSTIHGALHSANDVRSSSSPSSSSSSSSFNTLSSSAAVTMASSRVSQQQLQETNIGASLAQLDTSINTSVSDEDRAHEVTCTSVASVAAAATCRSSVATITGGFQRQFNHYQYSRHVHTTVDYLSSVDLSVPSSSCTAPYIVTSAFSGSDSSLVRSTLKRARRQSGEASELHSSSSGAADASQHRLSVTSLGLQSSDDMDDVTYVERRRKNNAAAKRSRDARRLKEQQTALRAASLEHENVQLRAELAVLRNQAAKLHSLIYNKLAI